MPATHRRPLNRQRLMTNSVRPAIVGDVPFIRDGIAAHNRFVHIGIADDGGIHAHHRGVIGELSSAPLSADKTYSHVTIAIIDSAVVADAVSPVAVMKPIPSVFPTPPGRRPESANVRSGHPLTGDPVITVVIVGPVTGRPQPTLFRTWRLLVDGQYGRSHRDYDRYAGEGSCGHKKEHQRRQNPAHKPK